MMGRRVWLAGDHHIYPGGFYLYGILQFTTLLYVPFDDFIIMVDAVRSLASLLLRYQWLALIRRGYVT